MRRSTAADAAAAAAGVGAGAITGLSTIRAVAAELRSKSRRSVGGMELEDDGLHLDDLPEAAEDLGFMDNCKAKGGAVFAVGQATGDTESCELTGANFRAVAERTAKKNADAAAAQAATAAARAQLAGTAQADRAGTSARVVWKAAFLEVKEKSEQEKEQSALKEKTLLARIVELEGHGGAGAPGPGM